MNIVKESSPHLRRKDTVTSMMADVLISLVPIMAFAIYAFTWHAVVNVLLACGVMVLSEYVYLSIRKRSFKEGAKSFGINNVLAPCISGTIFALMLPSNLTNPVGMIYFIIVAGALFGIIIGKLLFGGLGQNVFNPAATGYIFARLCFNKFFTNESSATNMVATGGTYLTYGEASGLSVLDLLIGKTQGSMGEVCKIAILIGLVYLLIRRAADWRVIVSFFGTFIFLTAIAGIVYVNKNASLNYFEWVAKQLLSGGVLFGGVYMITDPITMPITKPGRMLYGIIVASLVIFIRFFAAAPEGMAYSILLGNIVAAVLDYGKFSNPKYTKGSIIAMCSIIVAVSGILVWGLFGKLGGASL